MKPHYAALPKLTSAALAVALLISLTWLSGHLAGRIEHLGTGRMWQVAALIWIGAVAGMAYRVFVAGRVNPWRSVFFIILAWSFIVQFKAALIGLHGSAFISPDVQEVPSCHIAIASSVLNHLYQQYLALTSGAWQQWSPLTWGAAWLVITLVLGQAWCAWGCFYGGLDNGFAILRRKPLLKWVWLPKGARDLPAAILVTMLLLSLVTLQPIFCLWVCPLKLGTGFLDPNTVTRQIQLAIFATLGIVFLIVLPWLTKKRAFCGLLCPFGAWQAFFGRMNPYRVRIAPERCTQCQRCVVVCPTFAIERDSLARHQVLAYCNRCGECMDACPTGAIDYAIVDQERLGIPPRLPRALFLLSAWLVGGTVSLLCVPEALVKCWNWGMAWLR